MSFTVPTHIPQRLLQQQPPENPPTVVHWFRMDSLRLHDNPAFNYAVTSGLRFKAIFIVDPWFNASYSNGLSVNVWRFLIESLHDLDNKLQKRAYQTRLNVFVGQPTSILPEVFRRWNVNKLTFQASQISFEAKKHDEIIKRIATEHNIEVAPFYSQTLYNPNDILTCNGGYAPVTYKEFRRLLPIIGCPQEPIPEPNPLSVLMSCKGSGSIDVVDEVEGEIPTLQSLGFDPSEKLYTSHWVGGETEALSRLFKFGAHRASLSNEPIEWLMNKDSLSPYIRFGCLSVRQLFSQLRQFASTSQKGHALFQELTKNLLLREFAFIVGYFTPDFDQMKGNPMCIQLPWDDNPQYLEAWRQGQTGFPWIDAVIRQCRQEGWAHFLGRQSVAVFLTRGYMWLSWVLGKEFFQEFMLDFEQPLSSVCWMQSACSGFFCNKIESYNPCGIGKQMDMDGQYIKTYVRELQDFPAEYIHQPWNAPLYVQQEAGCIIGVNYPKPVVDVCNQEELCCKRIQTIMTALYEIYSSSQ